MIKNIFQKIISKLSKPNVSIMFSILSNWEEIAGDFFFKHCIPYKFFVKKSELYLACDDPNIATEVYFNQNTLKKRIKEKINLRVSVIKTVYDLNKFNKVKSIFEQPKKKEINITLKNSEIEKVNTKIKNIDDPELKEALKVFFKTMLILEKIRGKSKK